MKIASSTPQVNWKLIVRSLKGKGTSEARADAEKAILEVAGVPLRLRDARRGLFILTTAAAGGRPAIVETEAGLVCLVTLDDLMELVMERGPTLAEVMQTIMQS